MLLELITKFVDSHHFFFGMQLLLMFFSMLMFFPFLFMFMMFMFTFMFIFYVHGFAPFVSKKEKFWKLAYC
jgi:hypothetical protein